MSYRTILARLQAYEPKALIADTYEEHGLHCAVAAVLPPLSFPLSGNVTIEALARRCPEVREAIERSDMTVDELCVLQHLNDAWDGTPPRRYQHVIEVLTKKAAQET